MKNFTKGILFGLALYPFVDFYASVLDNLSTVITNKFNRSTIDDVVYCTKKQQEMEVEENSGGQQTFAIGFQAPEVEDEYDEDYDE